MISKSEIRQQIKNSILILSDNERCDEALSVWYQLINLPQFEKTHNILLYWSMKNELFSHQIVDDLSKSKTLFLPFIDGNELKLVQYTNSSQMKKSNLLNVWEPVGRKKEDLSIIDLAIVPGVAFDAAGNRLGRGGGYYDKLLPCLVNALKIGVGFSCQLITEVPVESHDVKMDLVLVGKQKKDAQ